MYIMLNTGLKVIFKQNITINGNGVNVFQLHKPVYNMSEYKKWKYREKFEFISSRYILTEKMISEFFTYKLLTKLG